VRALVATADCPEKKFLLFSGKISETGSRIDSRAARPCRLVLSRGYIEEEEMSRLRRCFAALSLGVALFLVIPAPSWATGIGDWQISVLLSGKVWQWVVNVWPGGDAQARRQGATTAQRKEGSMIDPNGTSALPDPTGSGTTGEEGSMIDPNGNQ
jgi:hypothetical protein